MPDSRPPEERNGAARMPLSEAIGAVLDVLRDSAGSLAVARHQLQDELPDEVDIDEADIPPPADQARHVAARLEECADALRNASG